MKKVLYLFVFGAVALNSFAQQSATDDFFTGKWNVKIFGTPQGDVELTAHLNRVGGILTGELTSAIESEPIKVDAIREEENSIEMDFFAQGYDLTLSLKKVDDALLEGNLSDMFDAKAERIPETDFFAGQWQVKVHDTPQGDVDITADLHREGEKLTGTLKSATEAEPIQIKYVDETESTVSIAFYAQGYDLVLNLKKVDEDHLEGDLSDMFDAEAERIKEADDFFAGQWELEFIGTPNGDAKMLMNLVRSDENLTGTLKPMDSESDEIILTDVKDSEDSIELFFTAQGYDVSVTLEKVDENNLEGSLLDMFDAKARRITK